MANAPKIAAVLMACGRAKRFGANKLLAQYAGRPLIETVLDNLPAERFFHVLVVTRYAEIAVSAAQRRFSVVENTSERDDAAETVRLGMEALPPGTDGALFLVCDQPRLRPQTICAVCDAFFETPDKIVAPVCQGTRGNPVLFPKAFFPALASLPPDRGGSFVIASHPEQLRLVECGAAHEFADVDTPQDLARL